MPVLIWLCYAPSSTCCIWRTVISICDQCVSRLLRSYTKMNASPKETLHLLVRKHLHVPFLPKIQDADILTHLERVCVRGVCLCRWEGERSESMAVHVTHIGIQRCRLYALSLSNYNSDDKKMLCMCLRSVSVAVDCCPAHFSSSCVRLCPGVCVCVAVWMKDLPSPSEEREPSCWHSAE